MAPRHTYVVSFHEQEDHVLLEEVRTQRRVRLADLSEIGEQIARWLAQDPTFAPRSGGEPVREVGSP
jgi:hypothetical protein